MVADALHCTRKSAEAVVQAGAAYLFCVKDNTPNLKDDIALYVRSEPMEHVSKTEKIALNLARDFKAKTNAKVPISGTLKRNLFDLINLKSFLHCFKLD